MSGERLLQYQALAAPPVQPAVSTASWQRQHPAPVRRVPANPEGYATSGALLRQEEFIGPDRWWRPASEPNRPLVGPQTGQWAGITEPSLFVAPPALSWEGEWPDFARTHRPREAGLFSPSPEPTQIIELMSWKGHQDTEVWRWPPRPTGGSVGSLEPTQIIELMSWKGAQPDWMRPAPPREVGLFSPSPEPTQIVELMSWHGIQDDFARVAPPRPHGLAVHSPEPTQVVELMSWKGFQDDFARSAPPRPHGVSLPSPEPTQVVELLSWHGWQPDLTWAASPRLQGCYAASPEPTQIVELLSWNGSYLDRTWPVPPRLQGCYATSQEPTQIIELMSWKGSLPESVSAVAARPAGLFVSSTEPTQIVELLSWQSHSTDRQTAARRVIDQLGVTFRVDAPAPAPDLSWYGEQQARATTLRRDVGLSVLLDVAPLFDGTPPGLTWQLAPTDVQGRRAGAPGGNTSLVEVVDRVPGWDYHSAPVVRRPREAVPQPLQDTPRVILVDVKLEWFLQPAGPGRLPVRLPGTFPPIIEDTNPGVVFPCPYRPERTETADWQRLQWEAPEAAHVGRIDESDLLRVREPEGGATSGKKLDAEAVLRSRDVQSLDTASGRGDETAGAHTRAESGQDSVLSRPDAADSQRVKPEGEDAARPGRDDESQGPRGRRKECR